jgi:hypothetical protein
VVLTILKNISDYPIYIYPYIMENKKCLKPPTSHIFHILHPFPKTLTVVTTARPLHGVEAEMSRTATCQRDRPKKMMDEASFHVIYWWFNQPKWWFTGDLTNQNGSLLVEVPSLKNNMPTKIVRWFTQPIQISNRGSDGTCAFQTLAIAAEPHFPVL